MTPKAVFWDMDGTLVDSEPLHDAALVAAMHSVGLVPPADLHERVLGQTAAVVYDMMRDEFGLDLPFDEWIARKYDYYLANVGGLQVRPGAVEVLRRAAWRRPCLQLRPHGGRSNLGWSDPSDGEP